jgi:hypothetical protein
MLYEIEQRYRNDVVFARVVETIRQMLSVYALTPGEIREAAMLAAYLHEMENPLPQMNREARVRAELQLRRDQALAPGDAPRKDGER